MSKTKPKKAAAAATKTSTIPLFVFGLDETGKPRGARFAEAKDDIVSAAMDMKCHVVLDPPAAFIEVGMKLPMGRIYASGKAFVPPIKKALYDQLIEAEKQRQRDEKAQFAATENANSATSSPPVAINADRPKTWDDVEVGHLVLIHESPADGWWEAVVIEREDDVMTLKLRDYPKLGTFTRHRTTLALIHPASA